MKEKIAGIDDATKCPCIGSIFVSGVVADKDTLQEWRKAGVKDSKLLSAKKRQELSVIIKETALAYSINEITPSQIDNKLLNLNEWEMLICLKTIDEMLQKTDFSKIILDNWEVSNDLFFKRLRSIMETYLLYDGLDISIKDIKAMRDLEFIAEHKADENHIIVGAASILSKTSSDSQYCYFRTKYGDFGSGSPADPRTRLFVWKNRKNPPVIIRKTWLTYKVLSKLEDPSRDPIIAKALKKLI